MTSLFGFKQFVAEDIDRLKKAEKSDQEGGDEKQDYFSALDTQLGIRPSVLNKILQTEPQVNTHFSLGGVDYQASPWQLVSRDENGGVVKLRHDGKNMHAYSNGRRYKGPPDTKTYRLSRQELAQFLTTGWTPALQAAMGGGGDPSMAGGAPGGMPPGPPPGGMPA